MLGVIVGTGAEVDRTLSRAPSPASMRLHQSAPLKKPVGRVGDCENSSRLSVCHIPTDSSRTQEVSYQLRPVHPLSSMSTSCKQTSYVHHMKQGIKAECELGSFIDARGISEGTFPNARESDAACKWLRTRPVCRILQSNHTLDRESGTFG
jgi:hypothetical protein